MFAIVTVFFVLQSCDEISDDDETLDTFDTMLQDKTWEISAFVYKLECNDAEEGSDGSGIFDLKDDSKCFFVSSDCNACPENDPNCTISCNEYCAKSFEWISYEVDFNATTMTGTHNYLLITPVFENGVQAGEEQSNETDHFTSSWTYNEDDETLTANFGDVYSFFDGQDFLNFPFSVVSYSETEIVLSGNIVEQGCELILDIVLK